MRLPGAARTRSPAGDSASSSAQWPLVARREWSPSRSPNPGRVVERPAPPPMQREPVVRNILYEGALPPGDPPMPPHVSHAKAGGALGVGGAGRVVGTTSPRGPEPIPLAQPKAIYFEGRGPVVQVLHGPTAFPGKIPQFLQTPAPKQIPYSNTCGCSRAEHPHNPVAEPWFGRLVIDTLARRRWACTHRP